MTKIEALKIIIKTMIDESEQVNTVESLGKRFNETTIQLYKHELVSILWDMHNSDQITIRSGKIYSHNSIE